MTETPMTIKITVSHCRGGEGNDVEVGAILHAPKDLTVRKARELIAIGYAIELKPAAGDVPAAGGRIETRDPAPDHRDPTDAAGEAKGPQDRKPGRGRRPKTY
jgi:hypothetical protein